MSRHALLCFVLFIGACGSEGAADTDAPGGDSATSTSESEASSMPEVDLGPCSQYIECAEAVAEASGAPFRPERSQSDGVWDERIVLV